MPARTRAGFTLIELLVAMAIIALLTALLLPAIQKTRDTAARTKCQNNLKQIGIAFHNYESGRGELPMSKRGFKSTATPPLPNAAQRSWAPDILPFLEQGNMFAGYDLSENWWLTPNDTIAKIPVRTLQCPSTLNPDRLQDKWEANSAPHKIGAVTDYFVVEGISADFNTNAGLTGSNQLTGDRSGVMVGWSSESATKPENKFEHVRDGTSNTIMVGEDAGREDVWRGRVKTTAYANNLDSPVSPNCARARGGAWATNDNPYEIGQLINWCGTGGAVTGLPPTPMKINASNEWGYLFYSFHEGGANFLFADGSVRHLADSTPVRTLGMMSTRAGGEILPTN